MKDNIFEFLADDTIAYILSLVDYDVNLFLINRKIHKLYHLSHQRYGINAHHMMIIFYIEKSDHEDYCSGAENEYESYYSSRILPLDKKYKSCKEMMIEIKEIISEIQKFCSGFLSKYETELKWLVADMDMHIGYSHYCHISEESVDHGLYKHDYRISVVGYSLLKD